MPTIQNIFTQGRMDSDIHPTFTDNKGYVRAENLRLSGEGDNGVFKSIKSSLKVSDHSNEEMAIIGCYKGFNDKMYYFLAAKNGLSRIVEYDVISGESRVIIEDTQVLRFDLIRWESDKEIKPYKFLLSINQIGDLLIFSDQVWEFPRVINLSRLSDYYFGFTLEDITLVKKPPQTAPIIVNKNKTTDIVSDVEKDRFVSFCYRYKYKDGDYTPLSFYTETAFEHKDNLSIDADKANNGMVNKYNSVQLSVNSGGKNVTDIEVYARDHSSNTAYRIHSVNKKKTYTGDNLPVVVDFNYSTNYEVLSDEETKYVFSKIPRYPKSQELVGNRLVFYNYREDYDLKDIWGNEINIAYYTGVDKKKFDKNKQNKTAVSMLRYKVGIIYYNDYNESTTVLLPYNEKYSEILLDFEDRKQSNQLYVKLFSMSPSWATKMKFAVQTQELNYDILYVTNARKIGAKLYLLLSGDLINRVKKDDLIIRIDEYAVEYKEYKVLSIKQYDSVESGLEIAGVYAEIEIGSDFILEKNSINNINKTFETAWNVIDSVEFSKNPNRYDATSGYEGISSIHFYSSYYNRGTLFKSDYGMINEGDSLTYSVKLNYGRDKHSILGGGVDQYGYITITETVYSSTQYASVYEFLKDNIKNPYLNVVEKGNEVHLITNDLFPNYVKLKVPRIYDWGVPSFANGRDEVAVVKVTTNVDFVKGIKPVIFRTKNKNNLNNIYYPTAKTYLIKNGKVIPDRLDNGVATFDIEFYNGYCWGNGIESYKVKDDFNAYKLNYMFNANTVLIKGYKEVHRKNDLCYSGIYNYELGINNIPVFNPSTANWKTLPIQYGDGQRIISTDSDLVVFNPNKIVRVLFGKSVVMDLRGNENLATSNEVLGDVIVLDYDYGISYNPESVAINGNIIYFTDKNKTRILALSGNQIIELNGQNSGVFKETINLFKKHNTFIGAYDEAYDEYVIGIDNTQTYHFNQNYKGFSHIQTYNFDYLFGMQGKFYHPYKGKLYEACAGKDYGNFAGQGLKKALLKYYVMAEINTDVMYQAHSLQSNVAWSTSFKTNLTESTVVESNYKYKESFYYTEIFRNTIGINNARGVGEIEYVNGNEITFKYIPEAINIGDELRVDANISSAITGINANIISVSNNTGFMIGQFAFTTPQRTLGYNPNGSPIRGKWMEVELTKTCNDYIYVASTTTEVKKSYL